MGSACSSPAATDDQKTSSPANHTAANVTNHSPPASPVNQSRPTASNRAVETQKIEQPEPLQVRTTKTSLGAGTGVQKSTTYTEEFEDPDMHVPSTPAPASPVNRPAVVVSTKPIEEWWEKNFPGLTTAPVSEIIVALQKLPSHPDASPDFHKEAAERFFMLLYRMPEKKFIHKEGFLRSTFFGDWDTLLVRLYEQFFQGQTDLRPIDYFFGDLDSDKVKGHFEASARYLLRWSLNKNALALTINAEGQEGVRFKHYTATWTGYEWQCEVKSGKSVSTTSYPTVIDFVLAMTSKLRGLSPQVNHITHYVAMS